MPNPDHELILGGARSGKSRTAEARLAAWLAGAGGRSAVLVATALPGEITGDAEMQQRIAQHRAGRAERLPGVPTVEAPVHLGDALRRLADPARLIVVDCLTLWLTQCLMPPQIPADRPIEDYESPWPRERAEFFAALRDSTSPIILVSNEIGMGVMPLSPESRAFVDALGSLHQQVAGYCTRVTLMVAGRPLAVKGGFDGAFPVTAEKHEDAEPSPPSLRSGGGHPPRVADTGVRVPTSTDDHGFDLHRSLPTAPPMSDSFDRLLPLPPVDDPSRRARVQAALDAKTKPVGALGRLESLALQLALIQGVDEPALHEPQLVVFAADHGIVAQQVSAYPGEVTRQMVLNFLAGGAAVSVLAGQHRLGLTVADCGVATDFAPHPALQSLKVAGAEHGTADSSRGPAMTARQCGDAIGHGRQLVARLPGNALLLGEMGIGNTSAAALLMARLTGEPITHCTGRGTGLDEAGLEHKRQVLARTLALHAGATDPLDALAALGGLEIATMVGAVQQAAATRRVIVVDGFITTAAVAVAAALQPAILACCVFSHRSQETGHGLWLRHLGVQALFDLDLRLGEGSGAALAWPLLESACRILAEMASFESAGVSRRSS